MKAIETVYNGYRFRSRLEARWAVFFDALGITYEYEKEGYDLDGVLYLPDFWLPELKVWVEIKGEKPETDWSLEQEKAWQLAKASQKPVAIFYGQIKHDPAPFEIYQQCPCCSDMLCDPSMWAECPQCHAIGFIRQSNGLEALPCKCWSGTGEAADTDHEYLHRLLDIMNEAMRTPRLIEAYTAARQARFEHGERGLPALAGHYD